MRNSLIRPGLRSPDLAANQAQPVQKNGRLGSYSMQNQDSSECGRYPTNYESPWHRVVTQMDLFDLSESPNWVIIGKRSKSYYLQGLS